MTRFVAPENDYLPLTAVAPGEPQLSVAVVIPAYNRSALLQRTLAALSTQRGYPGHLISVVVVDDGSEEDLTPVIDEASRRLRLTFVRQQRDGYGAGRARNLGVASTDADVILFVDGDCAADPELVAGHMAWHHRADNLLVVGSRQSIDSTAVAADALATGEIDLRRLALGDRPVDQDLDPNDWRRTFYRRTARLRHGTEAFRAALTHNCSLRRDRFLEIGGFSLDFKLWGGEDTELGWRAFAAGLFIVPENRAVIYHQEQEESHPEEGWREAHQAQNAALITSKIPHRFYRRLGPEGRYQVPKVSWVVTTPAGARAGELLSQMQSQTCGDWEAFFPFDPIRDPAEPRLKHLPPSADQESSLLEAVAASKGEYLALTAGVCGLHPLLLERVARFLDYSPRASTARVSYPGWDRAAADASWGAGSLPAFALVRRREWAKVLPAAQSLAEAWSQVRSLSWERQLEAGLVALPPAGATPASVPPLVTERDRIVEAGRRGRGFRALAYRLGKRIRPSSQDERPVLILLGSPQSLQAVKLAAAWARVETSGMGMALVLTPGAMLDGTTLEQIRAIDSPHLERAVLGASAGTGPASDWADFLATCLFVSLASEADTAAVRAWGYRGPVEVFAGSLESPRVADRLRSLRRGGQ